MEKIGKNATHVDEEQRKKKNIRLVRWKCRYSRSSAKAAPVIQAEMRASPIRDVILAGVGRTQRGQRCSVGGIEISNSDIENACDGPRATVYMN